MARAGGGRARAAGDGAGSHERDTGRAGAERVADGICGLFERGQGRADAVEPAGGGGRVGGVRGWDEVQWGWREGGGVGLEGEESAVAWGLRGGVGWLGEESIVLNRTYAGRRVEINW